VTKDSAKTLPTGAQEIFVISGFCSFVVQAHRLRRADKTPAT
jgi:hypothetical protein